MKGKESYMRIAVITGASSGMGRELVLQLDRIFPSQGSNLHPLHCRQILYH